MTAKWRRLLYLLALASGSFSLASAGIGDFPVWLTSPFYAAAFGSLVLSFYYAVRISRRETRNSVNKVIAKHALLNYLASNYRRRTFLFAIPAFGINLLFAGFNGAVGIRSGSAWYFSLAVYYTILSLMRFFLLHYEFFPPKEKKEEEKNNLEWKLRFRCGILLMSISIALSGVVVLVVFDGYGQTYPDHLTIYVVAMYTFSKMIASIVSIPKARRTKSPLVSSMKYIGYTDALVSLFSLQTAMFAAFGEGEAGLSTLMNTCTGVFVCFTAVFTGGYMAVSAKLRIRRKGKS